MIFNESDPSYLGFMHTNYWLFLYLNKVLGYYIAMNKLNLLLLLFCCNTFATNIKFNNYTTLDDNFSIKINSFAQDQLGYLWIGSEIGLFRYNAYKFEPISHCNHIRLKNILKLHVDSSNHIWISVRGSGLYKYNNGNCIKY